MVTDVYRGILPTYSGAPVETAVTHEEAALRACAQRIVWRILSLGITRKEEEKKAVNNKLENRWL